MNFVLNNYKTYSFKISESMDTRNEPTRLSK